MKRARRSTFLVPETFQMSAMDCGPASLKSLCDGFGVPVDYDALRATCRTDIDGTSINEVERVARSLGLDATQIVIPADHVLLEEAAALPAIAVLRHPNGNTHFAVIWSTVGGVVQMMDPAAGRLWRGRADVFAQLHRHTATVDAAAWRKWAGGEGFTRVLRRRIRNLGISKEDARELVSRALTDVTWRSIAALDAATRSVQGLADAAGVRRLRNAGNLIAHSLSDNGAADGIPADFWLVRVNRDDPQKLDYRGAVLLRVRAATRLRTGSTASHHGSTVPPNPALPERTRPLRALMNSLRDDGVFNPVILASLWLVNAGGLLIQALLLRSVFSLSAKLDDRTQLLGGMFALLMVMLILYVERLASAKGIYRAARRVEMHFRRLVLRKVPRLGDRYFQTRLPADVAERSHSIATVRLFPFVSARVVSCALEIALTALGIIWLDPALWPFALAAAVVALGVPLLAQPSFAAHELRVRVHTAVLGRFYLDTFLGVPAIRAHAAERSVKREQQSLLTEWAGAGLRFVRLTTWTTGTQLVVTMALTAWMILDHVGRHGDASGALLLVFWSLNLPFLGATFMDAIQRYQSRRNAAGRVLELVQAREDTVPGATDSTESGRAPDSAEGVAIGISSVSVLLSGQRVLHDINLHIRAGEHVAIVGASGAGKSTLVGLLLGWSAIAEGSVTVDGEPLTSERLDMLRRDTAWIDPAVQLWNRSLVDNLTYGSDGAGAQHFGAAMQDADLLSLLQTLPDGLQTPLGEGGGLVSGGEGQRVRLGRAMYRPLPGLVILDEPFRGLDRGRRVDLLRRARRNWSSATMLCVTHDIRETVQFDRVLVLDGGRIVEEGAPSDLESRPSRYADLLAADASAREWWTRLGVWRHVTVEKGVAIERP